MKQHMARLFPELIPTNVPTSFAWTFIDTASFAYVPSFIGFGLPPSLVPLADLLRKGYKVRKWKRSDRIGRKYFCRPLYLLPNLELVEPFERRQHVALLPT